MRTLVLPLVLSLSTGSVAVLGAQTSKLDGSWRLIRREVIAPDTTYEAPFSGVIVIHGRFFSQMLTRSPDGGIQQSGAAESAEAKAALYDAMIANAGTQEVGEKTITSTYLQAKTSVLIGRPRILDYHIHGDTLFTTFSDRWPKDSTKMVHLTTVYVRTASGQASPLDGAWKHIGNTVTAPDTSVHTPGLQGLMVIHGLHYSLTFAPESNTGAVGGGGPLGAAAKAARYDALLANAGVLTLSGPTLTQHVQVAMKPAEVGHLGVYHYRLHGDTLVATGTEPWKKDPIRTVSTDLVFVRMR